MEQTLGFLAWTPDFGLSGSILEPKFLMILIMSFIGASVVTRLAKINTSFNFSLNYMVMLAGCLLVNSVASSALIPVTNELIASAVTANVGMTAAGFALLLGYRNSV